MQVQYLYRKLQNTMFVWVVLPIQNLPWKWDVHIFDDQSEFIQEIVGLKFSDRA